MKISEIKSNMSFSAQPLKPSAGVKQSLTTAKHDVVSFSSANSKEGFNVLKSIAGIGAVALGALFVLTSADKSKNDQNVEKI